ncbi:DUF1990 family protein [Klenkia taihuensis]|uniref:DUF1990 family protein n=1 Tax=Klenkia taihuensis TaxID=1225127 RepID=UPI000B83A820|nr:DUF1990 domain-containing protein [Klenkia taihuensis]GHE12044.1 hypothetical protein GCM10011381_28150 [Klenkia taihuensis]
MATPSLPPGTTRPADADWSAALPGWRVHAETVPIGRGPDAWVRAGAVLEWAVKTRSGFAVRPPGRVREGADLELVAAVGPLRITEPVRVVAVVDTADRRGFAYATRPGHPVSGEEAFVVHRDPDGAVWLTLRSLTRPGSGVWRPLFPGLLVAQRLYRHRYRRALVTDPRSGGARRRGR